MYGTLVRRFASVLALVALASGVALAGAHQDMAVTAIGSGAAVSTSRAVHAYDPAWG